MDGIRRLKQDLEPESQYYLSTATRGYYRLVKKYASRSV